MRSHASAPHPRRRHARRAVVSAFLLALLALTLTSAPASAALNRPLLQTVSLGSGTELSGVATDSAGNVYVREDGAVQGIRKLDSAGNAANFSASAGYISGNKITGTPENNSDFRALDPFGFGLSGGLAIDQTGGPTDGYIYATTRFAGPGLYGGIYVYDSTGTYKGFISMGEAGEVVYNNVCGLGINQTTGDLFLSGRGANVLPVSTKRFTPVDGDPANDVASGTLATGGACATAVDSTGSIYTALTNAGEAVKKYDESQIGSGSPVSTEFDPGPGNALATDPSNDHVLVDRGDKAIEYTSAGAQVAEINGFLDSRGAAFGSGDKLYVSQRDGSLLVFGPLRQLPIVKAGPVTNLFPDSATLSGTVDPDSAGDVTGCEIEYGTDQQYSAGSFPCETSLPITTATTVGLDRPSLERDTTYHYRLVVESANGLLYSNDYAFTTPPPVESIETGEATGVTRVAATLHGSFVGRGEDHHYYFEYGETSSYGQTAPAPPGNDAGSAKGPQEVGAIELTGLKPGTEYHYRLVMTNSFGETKGADRTFTTPPAVTNLTTKAVTGLSNVAADLNGSFEADGLPVHYYFEYGPTAAYGSSAPLPSGDEAGPGPGTVEVAPVHIGGLQPDAIYHYRIVASNSLGKTFGQDLTFKTFDGPSIGNLSTAEVTATSAILKGEVNPRGGTASYHFEWGTTTAYGNSIPAPDADAGSGTTPVPVSTQLNGLESGITYHFRLVAENTYGKDVSPDQTFGFYPPACPNAQVRQETHSSHVPDCRGYELASPAFAGGATLMPAAGPSSPKATSPSRVSFAGFNVAVPDVGDVTGFKGELYVSTRTDSGWFTKYIGRPSTESPSTGGPPTNGQESMSARFTEIAAGTQASPSMDRIASYDRGYSTTFNELNVPASNAPYIWNASTGAQVERWPTNLGSVAGGNDFVGVPKASADFSHFIFSSNVVFAAGGEATPPSAFNSTLRGGCCSASIYDNNLKTGAVDLVSIKEGNVAFRGSVLDISEDGSHILMAEHGDVPFEYQADPPGFKCGVNAGCWPDPQEGLYLRVGDSHTYEIATGHKVHYVGSTADGETVYLTSNDQLTGEDTDTSSDLFVWHQSDPASLTRVSEGSGGSGNSDSCSVPWTQQCGVRSISIPAIGYEENNAGLFGNGHSDSSIASESGDIYFESPEQLDGAKGEFGQVNLYVYRHDAVHYVATLKDDRTCLPSLFGVPVCSGNPVARLQVTRDGSRAAFVTVSKLTSFENAGKSEMYTFAPDSGKVDCVSCRPDGQPPTSEVLASQNGLFLTEDGRTFFSTADPLVPRDTNEGEDVYEYTEGKAQLISLGIGKVNTKETLNAIYTRLGLVGVSANGTDVYFATSDNLVTQDHNGPELKIYDARTGGGFPAEVSPLKCEAADECHGPTGAPPGLPADRTSASLGKAPKRHAAHKKKRGKKHAKKTKKTRKHKGHARQGGDHRG